MHVLADVEPLEIVERAVLECWERFLRLDAQSPDRGVMKTSVPPGGMREHTSMHAYVKLAGLAEMPTSREPLMTATEWDPWSLAELPSVGLTVPGISGAKEDNSPHDMLLRSLDLIDTFPTDRFSRGYTDGSADGGLSNGGGGGVL